MQDVLTLKIDTSEVIKQIEGLEEDCALLSLYPNLD